MLDISKVIGGVATASAAALAIGLLGGAADPQSQYLKTVKAADTQFQIAEHRCHALATSPFRLCIAVALAEKWRTEASAEVKLRDTPDTRHAQRVMQAGGTLLVSLQVCSTRASWEQPACRDQAKDTYRRDLSRARLLQTRERDCRSHACPRVVTPATRVNSAST